MFLFGPIITNCREKLTLHHQHHFFAEIDNWWSKSKVVDCAQESQNVWPTRNKCHHTTQTRHLFWKFSRETSTKRCCDVRQQRKNSRRNLNQNFTGQWCVQSSSSNTSHGFHTRRFPTTVEGNVPTGTTHTSDTAGSSCAYMYIWVLWRLFPSVHWAFGWAPAVRNAKNGIADVPA